MLDGTKDPAARFRSHITRARDGRDKTYCGKWKRSLLRVGVTPTFTVVESGSGNGWDAAEKRWISYYKSVVGPKLTNLTEGGGGVAGHHWTLSEETKKKMSVANKGQRLSPESIQKMIRSKKGVPRRPEHIASAAAARVGKKRSPEAVANSASGHVGLKHTDEAKRKLREYHSKLEHRGRPNPKRSEASRSKTSESLKRYYASIGANKVRTQAFKSKVSTSMKKYHSSCC